MATTSWYIDDVDDYDDDDDLHHLFDFIFQYINY